MSIPYSPDEIAIVRKMFVAGADDAEIGARLGRPHRGIEKLRNKLGLRREAKPVDRRVYQHHGVMGEPIYSVERQYRCHCASNARMATSLPRLRPGSAARNCLRLQQCGQTAFLGDNARGHSQRQGYTAGEKR